MWQASASHLKAWEAAEAALVSVQADHDAMLQRTQAEHDAALHAERSKHNATVVELRAALEEEHAVLCQDFGVAPPPLNP